MTIERLSSSHSTLSPNQANEIRKQFKTTLYDNFVTKDEVFNYFTQNDEKIYEDDDLNEEE